MKLLRFGNKHQEKPGILDSENQIRDLSGIVDDIAGSVLHASQLDKLKNLDLTQLPIVENATRIGPCVGQVGKFLCIGLNYIDHVRETGATVPTEPVLFSKATSAINGPNDDILIPRDSTTTDWEVELGVVIGQDGKYISEKSARNHIAGFCVINDVSERTFQKERGGQWIKGKSCDTFGPIGPYLVTADEINDPQNLHLWLEVDGERKQDSNTKNMIFSVDYLVSYLSQFFTLQAGDIISTGTPPGVGLGHKPHPVFLKPGQVMRLGIEGLGEQQQTAILER